MTSLASVLSERGSPLNEEEIWALLAQGLSALHSLPARDLCSIRIDPSTLVLNGNGYIKFGREQDSDPMFGFVAAPEQAILTATSGPELWEHVHVYCLGSTLGYGAEYRLPPGRPPHMSADLEDLLGAMMEPDSSERIRLEKVAQVLRHHHVESVHTPFPDVVADMYKETINAMPSIGRPAASQDTRRAHFDTSVNTQHAPADQDASYAAANTSRMNTTAFTSMYTDTEAWDEASQFFPRTPRTPGTAPHNLPPGVSPRLHLSALRPIASPAQGTMSAGRLVNQSFDAVRQEHETSRQTAPGHGGISVHVRLLTGETLIHTATERTLVRDVFSRCLTASGLREPAYFGLSMFRDGMDEFLVMNNRIITYVATERRRKPRPHLRKRRVLHYELDAGHDKILNVNFGVEFYVTNVEMLELPSTRRSYFLQVLRDVSSGRINTPPDVALQLAGYAIQALVGDFGSQPDHSSDGQYLNVAELCSEATTMSLTAEHIEQVLPDMHRRLRGMGQDDAIMEFLWLAQKEPDYGILFYEARSKRTRSQRQSFRLWLGIGARGLVVYQDAHGSRVKPAKYPWRLIHSIDCRKTRLKIVAKESEMADQSRLPIKQSLVLKSEHQANYLHARCKAYHRFHLLLQEAFPEGVASPRRAAGVSRTAAKSPDQAAAMSTSAGSGTPTRADNGSDIGTPVAAIQAAQYDHPSQHTPAGDDFAEPSVLDSSLLKSVMEAQERAAERHEQEKKRASRDSVLSIGESTDLDGRPPHAQRLQQQDEESTTVRSSTDNLNSDRETIVHTVVIERGAVGLGFRVVGGGMIESVKEAGPAKGLLRKKDRILKINGTSVESASHDELVEMLRTASSPVAITVASRPRTRRGNKGMPARGPINSSTDGSPGRPNSTAASNAASSSPLARKAASASPMTNLRMSLRFQRLPNGSPGFQIGRSSSKKAQINVTKVDPNTPAFESGLRPGFMVVSINGHDVGSSSLQRASAALGSADSIALDVVARVPSPDPNAQVSRREALSPTSDTPATARERENGQRSRTPSRSVTMDLQPPLGAVKALRGVVEDITIVKRGSKLGLSVSGGSDKNLHGAYVRSVAADSPAAEAGVQEGDRILEVDSEELPADLSHDDILKVLSNTGNVVHMKVLHLGKQQWDALAQQALLLRRRRQSTSKGDAKPADVRAADSGGPAVPSLSRDPSRESLGVKLSHPDPHHQYRIVEEEEVDNEQLASDDAGNADEQATVAAVATDKDHRDPGAVESDTHVDSYPAQPSSAGRTTHQAPPVEDEYSEAASSNPGPDSGQAGAEAQQEQAAAEKAAPIVFGSTIYDEAKPIKRPHEAEEELRSEPSSRTVVLYRDGKGFGFAMRADNSSPGQLRLLVSKLAKNGAAAQSGELSVGDEILRINDTGIASLVYEDAVLLVKSSPDELKLHVAVQQRDQQADSAFSAANAKRQPETDPTTVATVASELSWDRKQNASEHSSVSTPSPRAEQDADEAWDSPAHAPPPPPTPHGAVRLFVGKSSDADPTQSAPHTEESSTDHRSGDQVQQNRPEMRQPDHDDSYSMAVGASRKSDAGDGSEAQAPEDSHGSPPQQDAIDGSPVEIVIPACSSYGFGFRGGEENRAGSLTPLSVGKILETGAAYKAGVRKSDVVQAINGKPTKDMPKAAVLEMVKEIRQSEQDLHLRVIRPSEQGLAQLKQALSQRRSATLNRTSELSIHSKKPQPQDEDGKDTTRGRAMTDAAADSRSIDALDQHDDAFGFRVEENLLPDESSTTDNSANASALFGSGAGLGLNGGSTSEAGDTSHPASRQTSRQNLLMAALDTNWSADGDDAWALYNKRKRAAIAAAQIDPDRDVGGSSEKRRELVRQLKGTSAALFRKQFKELGEVCSKLDLRTFSSDATRPLNRYADVLPLDATRVKVGPNRKYVNANVMLIPKVPPRDVQKGYSLDELTGENSEQIIMAQGPKENTTATFWEMVWDNKCQTIVMLTAEVEGGHQKCHPYYPTKQGKRHTYGSLDVENEHFCENADMAVCFFTITHRDTKQIHKTVHFRLKSWEDHSAPGSPKPLINLLREWRNFQNGVAGPALIHCSAGVGRSGVFATLVAVRAQLLSYPDQLPPVQAIVLILRKQRNAMVVQKKDQYLFIYLALRQLLQDLSAK